MMDGKVKDLTGLFCVRCGCMVDVSPRTGLKLCICGNCPIDKLSPDERKALSWKGGGKLPVEVVLRIAGKSLTGKTSRGYIPKIVGYIKQCDYEMDYKQAKRIIG